MPFASSSSTNQVASTIRGSAISSCRRGTPRPWSGTWVKGPKDSDHVTQGVSSRDLHNLSPTGNERLSGPSQGFIVDVHVRTRSCIRKQLLNRSILGPEAVRQPVVRRRGDGFALGDRGADSATRDGPVPSGLSGQPG